MPLTVGAHLGSYEILAAIGAGGMGEVYRARDTKLGRDVALKILPDLFAADPDRLARFQREAQVLASLNHAHIGHIYGLEESNEVRALVLELVEGPTLADRISHGPIPLDEAVSIARQIAEALEAAHEQGIVHRDLKPANIKVREDGTVKVLDFGLAKALEPDAVLRSASVTASPTISMAAMTQMGVILGTAAYMSPEQAHGRAADRRADIFSFGAVLFEMLSGRQAFTGESVGETLASVLKVDPDWNRLPATTPSAIRALLGRCLTKDPKRRLQAIGEARIVLEQPMLEEPESTSRPARSRLAPAWPIATVVAVVVAGVALWGGRRPAPIERRPVLRFNETLEVANTIGSLALSRDGSRLAYVSGPERTIHVRTLDGFETRNIPGTENATNLCFSPEGQWISFLGNARGTTGRQLKKVAVAGGQVQVVLEGLGRNVGPPTPCWADDGNIYFAGGEGSLQRISSNGGQPQTLASPDPKNNERNYFSPHLLPGGSVVVAGLSAGPRGSIVAVNLKAGDKKALLDREGRDFDAGLIQFVPSNDGSSSGHLLVYDGRSGSLLAAPFDARRVEVEGPLVPVVDGIQSGAGPWGKFSVSPAGILVYVAGEGFGSRTLVWVDRQGREESTASPFRRYSGPRLSPSGLVAAFEIQGDDRADIWTYDLVRKSSTQVTTESPSISPRWTADGKRLIYAAVNRAQGKRVIVSVPADRSGPPSPVGSETSVNLQPESVSRDGTIIGILVTGAIRSFDPATPENGPAWTLSLSAPSTQKLGSFLNPKSLKVGATFSPDGRWLAYAESTRSDARRADIFVTPYPGPAGHVQISTEGGTEPRWRSDGRELYYRTFNKMMAVDIELGAEVRAGAPKELFDLAYQNGYDVAPDGKRFLMIKSGSAGQSNQLTYVVNWFEELKARVPAK